VGGHVAEAEAALLRHLGALHLSVRPKQLPDILVRPERRRQVPNIHICEGLFGRTTPLRLEVLNDNGLVVDGRTLEVLFCSLRVFRMPELNIAKNP
jgi:hypothetical protein